MAGANNGRQGRRVENGQLGTFPVLQCVIVTFGVDSSLAVSEEGMSWLGGSLGIGKCLDAVLLEVEWLFVYGYRVLALIYIHIYTYIYEQQS